QAPASARHSVERVRVMPRVLGHCREVTSRNCAGLFWSTLLRGSRGMILRYQQKIADKIGVALSVYMGHNLAAGRLRCQCAKPWCFATTAAQECLHAVISRDSDCE